jgi:hypothetical protein
MPLPNTTASERLSYAESIDPSLRTIVPFEVCVERTEHGYMAVVQELDEYGLGDTQAEALEDLGKTLQELYFSLERDHARLSSDLLAVWTRLQSYVQRVHR